MYYAIMINPFLIKMITNFREGSFREGGLHAKSENGGMCIGEVGLRFGGKGSDKYNMIMLQNS